MIAKFTGDGGRTVIKSGNFSKISFVLASALSLNLTSAALAASTSSAVGRCIAAFSGLSKREIQQAFRHLRWEQEPSFEDYWASVTQTRERGYAQDVDQYMRGVSSVSAPVLGPDGKPIALISNASLTLRMPSPRIDAIGIDLRARTRLLSQALSGQPEERGVS